MTHPLRRPVFRRLDARINHMIAVAIQAQLLPAIAGPLEASTRTLGQLEASVGAANHSARMLACDMDLMLASVVREIARLQNQVEVLQAIIARQTPQARAGLALVETDDDAGPVARHAGVERSKVG